MNWPPPHLPGSYLVVETTNKCSLACVHCSVSEAGHPHHQRVGFIDPRLVLELFDDLVRVRARFDTLILFWLGEPLIHPHVKAIYQAALRANATHRVFGKVELHTNATHLSPANVRVALNDAAVPQVWHFSLDAARRETYRAIKGRDRFEAVEANVARFVAEKGRLGARWPRPVFQFIVSSQNASEVPAFRRRWEAACRRAGLPVVCAAQDVPGGEQAVVYFRQLDCPTPELQARENAVFREAMRREGLALPRADKAPVAVSDENLAACGCWWKSPVVSWNGDVTVCTRDNLHVNKLGNLADAPFSALWWGPQAAARRAAVGRGDYSALSMCSTCFIPRSSNYTDVSAEEVDRQRAWAGL